MLHSCLASALRYAARNRLHTAINVASLALGMAAAIMVALYVRNELTFEHFLPGYSHIYRISTILMVPGEAPVNIDTTAPGAARWIATRTSTQAIARIAGGGTHNISVGSVEFPTPISWADPEFFDVIDIPAVAGDPRNALRTPDAVVLSVMQARRLFGRDNPVGSTLLLDRIHPLRVAAVVADLPPNTHFNFAVVGSTLAAFSPVRSLGVLPTDANEDWRTHTYLRLQTPAEYARVRRELDQFTADAARKTHNPAAWKLTLPIIPISRIHLMPPAGAAMKARGSRTLIYAISVVGALILLVAAVNFINLTTARAARRGMEVGIRKTFGARRRDIVVQFLGEAVLYCLVATLAALALVELLMPAFNQLTQASLAVNCLREPSLLLAAFGLACVLGIGAGIYPAVVHASHRTATALHSGAVLGRSTPRQVLVMLQFAVLICLLAAIGIIVEQTRYARNIVARIDATNVFAVDDGCRGHGADTFRSVPGVVAAACSDSAPLGYKEARSYGTVRAGIRAFFDNEVVGFGFFELYGIRPLAGRLFQPGRGGDSASAAGAAGAAGPAEAIVINETAVRKFGFASAQAAVGQTIDALGDHRPSQIIGVVPDFPMRTVRTPIDAAVFHVDPAQLDLLSVKLDPAHKAQALLALDSVWKSFHGAQTINRYPVEQALREVYAEIVTDGLVFASCAAVALILGCLGIFGLASFIAERRTREMGIRKALGAGRGDIVRLLVWESSRPVLWANLIAWPVCYVVMRHWLLSFAYHVDLGPLAFIAASAAALTLSWLTVLGHALSVAHAKPVVALRYQ